MSLLTLQIDAVTESDLDVLAASTGLPPAEYAVRLLRRAIRAKRPKPAWDPERLKSYSFAHGVEELEIAESAREHRAELLDNEDSLE